MEISNDMLLVVILFTHWLADFVFQSDETAKNKSSKFKVLLGHALSYAMYWQITICLFYYLNKLGAQDVSDVFLFGGITFASHLFIDYVTSKYNKKLWEEGRTHDFFVSIGFDQLLHYLQLWFTFKLLFWPE